VRYPRVCQSIRELTCGLVEGSVKRMRKMKKKRRYQVQLYGHKQWCRICQKKVYTDEATVQNNGELEHWECNYESGGQTRRNDEQ